MYKLEKRMREILHRYINDNNYSDSIALAAIKSAVVEEAKKCKTIEEFIKKLGGEG